MFAAYITSVEIRIFLLVPSIYKLTHYEEKGEYIQRLDPALI